ncbi:hypothetical protein Tco_1320717 [Tanacetum coccineum]
MGDENPIRTLRDYSRPSHEGYRNTIELPDRNNVVTLRSDTIWLVQNGCSFHGLRSEDPNQHLKDFQKLVDSLDLDVANRERMRSDFMQLSLEAVEKLKEEIRLRENNSKRIQKITSVIDWSFLANHGLDRSFFDSINTNNFSGPQWVNLFQINELVYRELVHEFFASIEFESTVYRYEPEHLGVKFRLRDESSTIDCEGRAFVDGILVNNEDDEFVVGGTSVKKVRDPRVKLAHHCIVTTISGRKESTQRITKIDLFYLYCIYAEELNGGACYWHVIREVGEDDEVKEEVEEGAGGSFDVYRNMSRGDWQYLSTRYNLDPHLQIDLFPESEVDYPPYGYTRPMPPGYDYRYGPDPGGSD